MHGSALTESQFADFASLIAGHLGIKMPPTKRVMLQSRLHRRLRELGLDRLELYHERFFSDAAWREQEMPHLFDLATTNKTDFFREPDHFDVLARQILPAWLQTRRSEPFRVWCAGCSTGEEAYTIAMVLIEERIRTPFEFTVRATDVSTRVLQAAMHGVYREDRVQSVPLPMRQRYFLRSRDREAGLLRVSPEVRSRVRFGHLNFLAPDYGLPEIVDVVFFRNVMIYFDRPTQQAVVGRICRYLRPGGDLFIGHSETLQGLDLPVRPAGAAHYRHRPKGSGS